MADNVTLVRMTWPAFVSRPTFHVGILAATASINGCSSTRPSHRREGGIPRYLHGNGDTTHGKTCWTLVIVLSSKRIGTSEQLGNLDKAKQVIVPWRQQDDEIVRVE
jgi:hypothetical protein